MFIGADRGGFPNSNSVNTPPPADDALQKNIIPLPGGVDVPTSVGTDGLPYL